ncbi:MAG: hypothetical protein ABIE74_03420 [Pseudomonadota bacterium]
MNFKRILIATVVVTIVNALFGWLTCGWLFNWVYQLEPVNVWIAEAEMTPTFMLWANLGSLVIAFLFVLIFARLQDCLPGKCRCCRGISYGVIVWLLGVLPGMFSIYMFMNINKTVPIYLALSGLVRMLILGGITGLIVNKKVEGESCCCGSGK